MAALFTTENGAIINLDNVVRIADGCVTYVHNDPGTYEHKISKNDLAKLELDIRLCKHNR